jgi:hypothetical protein
MAGYRQSSFDPYAEIRGGGPKRPFNWVQWTGFALALLGAAFAVAFLLGEAGVIPKFFFKSPAPFTSLPLIGLILINSRREDVADPAPELAPARKRWTVITAIVCAVILGAAALISAFTGA